MKPIEPVLTRAPNEPRLYFARDQAQYNTLPALRGPGPEMGGQGKVTSRWQLSFRECLRVFWTGEIWLQMLTFDEPLQPVKILTEEPTIEECK